MDFEIVTHESPQMVLATASAPEPCPYPACLQCSWGLAVADHTNYQAIVGRYEEKIAQLQTSTSLTSDERCSQCVILNHHLMSMERALYDKKHLGEEQVLAKMTTLRTTPRADAPWGMIGQPASTHGAGASSAAAADGAPAADADDVDSDAKRKKKRTSKKKPSLARFQAYTAEEWDTYYKDCPPRLEWKDDQDYEVSVETDEGLKPYPLDVQAQLLRSYWGGAISCVVNFELTSGRNTGHQHTYTVYWLGGSEGMQFSNKDTAKKREVIISIYKRNDDRHWRQWESSAGASSSWRWD